MSEVSDRLRMNKELRQFYLKGNFFVLNCKNKFRDKAGKITKCPYEDGPYGGAYVSTMLPKGVFYCPICYDKSIKTRTHINIRNLKAEKYVPVVIALACAGLINKSKKAKSGKQAVRYYDTEKCGHFMGVDLLINFKKKLVKGELKCPECGSKRFVRTMLEKTQAELWQIFYDRNAKYTKKYMELHGAKNATKK